MTTRSKRTAEDIAALLRARNAFLWIRTGEEARAEEYLVNACGSAAYQPHLWDCVAGVCNVAGVAETYDNTKFPTGIAQVDAPTDPGAVLVHIRQRAIRPYDEGTSVRGDTDRNAWIMRDLHKWTEGAVGIQTSRQLRNLARTLSGTKLQRAQAVIVITPQVAIPP